MQGQNIIHHNPMALHEPVGAPIVIKTSLGAEYQVFRVKPVSRSEDKVFYMDNRERPLDVTQTFNVESLEELQLNDKEKIIGWRYV